MLSVLPATTARPLKTPLPLLDTYSKVDIYHPDVHSGPPILQFRAFPSEPDSGIVGVHLGVVLDACFVIAGNQPGELHLYAPPQERVAGADSDPDGLLVPGMYHFVVVQPGRGLNYNYHLCESFAAWTPPVEIPTRWLGGEAERAPPPPNISDISAAVKSDNKLCIMTRAATGLQATHLVPTSEGEWFRFHYRVLAGYGGDPEQDLNSVRNEIAWWPVFVNIMAHDLAHEYHLRAIDLLTRIRRGYLFIRFAWIVLKFLTPGLADAAAAIRPLEEGEGFLKRKRADDTGGGSKKSQKGGIGSDGANRSGSSGGEEDVGGADDGDGELTENGESVPTTKDDDEAQLAVFEILDAGLKTRPLNVDDVQAGRYPGFAAIKRLEREYRQAHPQVSAVMDPRVWEEGDND
ncbi:hypothetical protein B0H16DRAFT_1740535 [Mycena metata]|uniref:HNH nuclease domain-containing protein n=1 Tax=Mycena metata TaxID=1033252 RepID=A0AAD7HD16_9AGAR|nr:hypothetical protein B0H16DRAFT_1740535 [Mycena metata]